MIIIYINLFYFFPPTPLFFNFYLIYYFFFFSSSCSHRSCGQASRFSVWSSGPTSHSQWHATSWPSARTTQKGRSYVPMRRGWWSVTQSFLQGLLTSPCWAQVPRKIFSTLSSRTTARTMQLMPCGGWPGSPHCSWWTVGSPLALEMSCQDQGSSPGSRNSLMKGMGRIDGSFFLRFLISLIRVCRVQIMNKGFSFFVHGIPSFYCFMLWLFLEIVFMYYRRGSRENGKGLSKKHLSWWRSYILSVSESWFPF